MSGTITPSRRIRLDTVESADIRGRMTRLRPMRADEAPIVHGWLSDPDVQPFWGGSDRHKSLEEYVAHIEPHYLDGSRPAHGRNFIVETEPQPIGMINYNRVDIENRSTEIDIVIGHPDYRERGYGSDALRAFLRFLFDTVGLHRVWLATYDYNARARHVYEKVGFVREGVMRQSDLVEGRWVDAVVYGILEHELHRGNADA